MRTSDGKSRVALALRLAARSLWHLLKYGEPFHPDVFQQEEEKMKRKKLARLQNLAASLHYPLVPQP